ncbi:MAG: hypothetical protein AAF678_00625 [Pseudomonadota bacterium]
MTFLRGLIFASGMLAAPTALACAFHTYVPQPTLVDRLLNSEHVVLARNSETELFRYRALEAIKGQTEEVSIPALVDTVSRRKLSADRTARVLFARDGAYGPWQRLAYVDAGFQPVLDAIVERLPEWELGDDAGRYQFFAGLLNHPHPYIHILALRELDQADYSALRQLELDIPMERLAARLNDPAEFHLKPIRILLLGLAGREALRPALEKGVASSLRVGGGVLGAYATAYLETHGAAGVNAISEQYLRDEQVSLEARELLLEALAIHSASGAPQTASAVQQGVAEALRRDPTLAPGVARHFGVRADWSFEAPMTDILDAEALTSVGDLLVVTQYVALASQGQSDAD